MKPLLRSQRTLADLAYQQIRKSIIAMEFMPGQMIYETEIAQMLAVSRTPVREAFMLLKNEGMVEIIPQKGIRVSLISQRKVDEICFVRKALELTALEQAAELWDEEKPECMELLKTVNEELSVEQKNMFSEDPREFLRSNERFHLLILGLLQNDTLLEIYKELSEYLNRARYFETLLPRHRENVLQQHMDILDALRKRDRERLREVFCKHIDREVISKRCKEEYAQFFSE